MTLPGESDTPGSIVDHAAAAALAAAEQSLESMGTEAERIFVMVRAKAGTPDCSTAGHGYEDGRDLLVDLLTHAHAVAEAGGLRLDVIPNLGGQGQG